MKYIALCLLFLITGCETIKNTRPTPAPFAMLASALTPKLENEEVEEKPIEAPAKTWVIPTKSKTVADVKLPPVKKINKIDITEKMPIEKLPLEKTTPTEQTKIENKIAPTQQAQAQALLVTGSISPKQPIETPKALSGLTIRFAEAKDELTPYEQKRLTQALQSNIKKVTVTVAPDNTRQGFALLTAVKKRSDVVRDFLPKSVEASVTYAPQQEVNTVRIDF